MTQPPRYPDIIGAPRSLNLPRRYDGFTDLLVNMTACDGASLPGWEISKRARPLNTPRRALNPGSQRGFCDPYNATTEPRRTWAMRRRLQLMLARSSP